MKTVYLTISALLAGKGFPISLTDEPPKSDDPPGPDFLPEDLSYPASKTGDDPAGKIDIVKTAATMRDEKGQSPQFKTIGRRLTRFLTQSESGRDWLEDRVATLALADGHHRTILRIASPELRSLPWELMRDEWDTTFFTNPNAPVVHWSAMPPASQIPLQKWPLRVLVVVGSAANDESISAEEEVHGLEDALRNFGRLVELNVRWRPSLEELRAEFVNDFRPHVFHFIGHGRTVGGSTFLRFDLPAPVGGIKVDGRWDMDAIRLLVQEWAPRLVFLNACRTDDPLKVEETVALTEAFATRVPAVIGMRGNVRGEVAAAFSREFYRVFAFDKPVDVAFAKARLAAAAGFPMDRRDWILPRLTLSVDPDAVLPMQPRPLEAERIKIEQIEEFLALPRFVNRSKERLKLCNRLDPLDSDPIDKETRYQDLIVISGESEVGKSELLRYALAGCKLRGWQVAYVTMGDGIARSFVNTLRLIRGDPSITGLARSTLDPAAFSEFNHQLNHLEELAKNRLPEMPAGVIDEIDPKREIPAELKAAVAPKLAESLALALQRAAGGSPLVVALDQVEIEKSDCVTFLIPHFLKPLAERFWPPLRLLLVLRKDQFTSYGLETLAPDPIGVEKFAPEEFILYGAEYCRRFKFPLGEKLEKAIEGIGGALSKPWEPACLRFLDQFMK